MSNAKLSASPMKIPSTKSSLGSVDDPSAQTPHREAVGSLIWLMHVAYQFTKLLLFMAHERLPHDES